MQNDHDTTTHRSTVSVIMPVYNHAYWVEAAVQSVLMQTFSDWELIIIDDASTDDSWAVLQRFFDVDVRIRLIRHAENCGAPITLNEGLSLAQGAYLAILNSDDVWAPNRIEVLVQYLQSHRVDMVCTDMQLIDSTGQKHENESDWLHWFEALKHHYHDTRALFATLLRGNFLITTSNFMFQRHVYEALGGFGTWRYVHDYDYALRVLVHGFRIEFLPDALLSYRLHGTNTIRENALAAIEENYRLLLEWLPALSENLDAIALRGLQRQLLNLYHYTQQEWRTHLHERLVAKEGELFPLIADRDGWIAERDAVIQAQQLQIEALINNITTQTDALHTMQTALQQREEWVAERDVWIRQREQWITERDALICQLRSEQQAVLNSRAYRVGTLLAAPLRRGRQWLARYHYA